MIRLTVISMVGAVSLGAAGWAIVAPPADRAEAAPPTWNSRAAVPWAPPTWFPATARDDLWVLEHLEGEPAHAWGPRVDAHAAMIADLDEGRVLWARDPDGLRGIASLTKLFSSLALTSFQPDLSREVCVGFEQWPSRPGARSKLETGDCHAGDELLGAALVASDNRGAFSFPALVERDYFEFVSRMREVSHDLRIRHAEFGDPAGLEDENRASPRAVLKAVVAVAAHPTLAPVASAPTWHIEPERGDRRLYTTNRVLAAHHEEFDTLAAKTGYTDTSRYCFATVVRSRRTGRRFAVVVLAAQTGSSRWRDVLSMMRWADEV